jgi:hypothetical protein
MAEMELLSKALAPYDEAAAAQPAVSELARRIALTAIRAPEIVQLDHLQDLAAVRALTQSMFESAFASLYICVTEQHRQAMPRWPIC